MSYNIRTTLDVQDNLNIGKNANISGSLSVTGSINGNLNGTATSASYVLNAVSSSFARTASFAPNYLLLSNTSSFATTGSNIFIGNQTITGSLIVSSSADPQFIIGNNLLTISSSGQMGISGSIVPNTHNLYSLGTTGVRFSTLFVQGTVNGNTGLFNNINMGSSSPMSIINNTSQTVAQWYGPTANLRLQSGSTPAYVDNGYRLQINSLGAVSGGLYITGSTNQSLIRVDIPGTDGILFVTGSGRVGIGTITPGYDLDILTPSGDTNYLRVAGNGVSNTNGYITLGNVTGTAGVFAPLLSSKSSNLSYPGMYFIGDGASGTDSGTQPMIRFDGRINNGTVATRPLIGFANAGTDLVTILANGNSGFGTNAPSTKLHAKGTTSGSGVTAFRVENLNSSASMTINDLGTTTLGGSLILGGSNSVTSWGVNGSATIMSNFGNHSGQIELRPNNLSNSLIYFSNGGSGGGLYLGTSKYFSTPFSVFASGSVIVGDYSGFANNTAAPARFAVSGSNNQTLVNIGSPGSSSIFNISGSGVVTINGSIPVTRNATGYNVGRFTNSASFDNIRVAISSSGNPVASSVSGSVNVFYNTISSVVGSAISSSVNTGAIFTTGSWSLLTSATLGSGGDTITSHIQDQDRGRLYRATFIQTAGPTSGSVVIERLI